MTDDLDRLQQAFRAIARDDAADAERAARRIEATLVAELRARRLPDRPRSMSRVVGLAMAAALLAALVAPVWIVTRGPRPSTSAARNGAAQPVEIATAFLPLAYSAVPLTGASVVRLEVPRTALAAFGLTPLDIGDNTRTGTVLADVLVGDDGLARAVRFVRAARAPGVTP
jgi:hypothetical protein